MPGDAAATRLDALQAILASARELATRLAGDPVLDRLIKAFGRFPEPDRETILRVLERDATWCRIVEQTADVTGISVRPNPHASLYVHLLEQGPATEPETLRRDVDVIGFGIQRAALLVPMLFQAGVHEQWIASARELVRVTDPALLDQIAQLAREALALIAEVRPASEPAPDGPPPGEG